MVLQAADKAATEQQKHLNTVKEAAKTPEARMAQKLTAIEEAASNRLSTAANEYEESESRPADNDYECECECECYRERRYGGYRGKYRNYYDDYDDDEGDCDCKYGDDCECWQGEGRADFGPLKSAVEKLICRTERDLAQSRSHSLRDQWHSALARLTTLTDVLQEWTDEGIISKPEHKKALDALLEKVAAVVWPAVISCIPTTSPKFAAVLAKLNEWADNELHAAFAVSAGMASVSWDHPSLKELLATGATTDTGFREDKRVTAARLKHLEGSARYAEAINLAQSAADVSYECRLHVLCLSSGCSESGEVEAHYRAAQKAACSVGASQAAELLRLLQQQQHNLKRVAVCCAVLTFKLAGRLLGTLAAAEYSTNPDWVRALMMPYLWYQLNVACGVGWLLPDCHSLLFESSATSDCALVVAVYNCNQSSAATGPFNLAILHRCRRRGSYRGTHHHPAAD